MSILLSISEKRRSLISDYKLFVNFHRSHLYNPGPANGQKKKVVLVNDPVFSQLTYFGSDRAIQPKRPKMAEIWLKSNFLCVSMVSHPITSLSFTIATLVALIDP